MSVFQDTTQSDQSDITPFSHSDTVSVIYELIVNSKCWSGWEMVVQISGGGGGDSTSSFSTLSQWCHMVSLPH